MKDMIVAADFDRLYQEVKDAAFPHVARQNNTVGQVDDMLTDITLAVYRYYRDKA